MRPSGVTGHHPAAGITPGELKKVQPAIGADEDVARATSFAHSTVRDVEWRCRRFGSPGAQAAPRQRHRGGTTGVGTSALTMQSPKSEERFRFSRTTRGLAHPGYALRLGPGAWQRSSCRWSHLRRCRDPTPPTAARFGPRAERIHSSDIVTRPNPCVLNQSGFEASRKSMASPARRRMTVTASTATRISPPRARSSSTSRSLHNGDSFHVCATALRREDTSNGSQHKMTRLSPVVSASLRTR